MLYEIFSNTFLSHIFGRIKLHKKRIQKYIFFFTQDHFNKIEFNFLLRQYRAILLLKCNSISSLSFLFMYARYVRVPDYLIIVPRTMPAVTVPWSWFTSFCPSTLALICILLIYSLKFKLNISNQLHITNMFTFIYIKIRIEI